MAASLWWDEPETSKKNDQQSSNDDLLVFGYACKLFRDDEKAKDIDNGKLLIPWMGDERLMIDRYDGRGHLYDLATHDSENVENKNPVFSEEEEAIEKACEDERYLELHTDLREAQIYEEEEWKRYYLSLQEGYKAVGFSYDEQYGDGQGDDTLTETMKEEDDELPFVPPEELQLPPDLQIPKCRKHNARIEKTASFIAQHGIQMEIMLKTKQAGNSQFDFLHFENELNPYYKHMVSMIKSGKYKPLDDEEEDTKKDDDDSHSYLHPSLSSATQLPPPPPPPSKPIELPKVSIHDTPYGALIKSIRQNTETSRLASLSMQNQTNYSSHSTDYQSYQMPFYDNPPPPGTEPVTLPIVSSLNGQAFVDQLYSQPLPPGTEDNDGVPYQPQERSKTRRRRSSSSDSSSSTSSSSSSSSSHSSRKKRKSSKHTESNRPMRIEGPSLIVPPPPEVQPIVDRMAMYVAKNGTEFEIVVMSRKDPRFQFLNEYHAHYPYYKLKKERYIQELGKQITETETLEDKSSQNLQRSVSFSIKPRPKDQEGSQQPGKPWLFEYDSSEGEEERQREQMSDNQSGSVTPTAKVCQDEDSQKEMEEKLKDKLASAVKERISQTHKEKQLQMERKKKAAMFLNLIKSSQPQVPAVAGDDSASLYVGEALPEPVVYEYDNQPVPQFLSSKTERSRSSKGKKRRRRSPTPPSAYNLERRSPTRPSPSRWMGRPSPWSSMRDRTPPWQRRNRDIAVRRSRSRSPHRKDDKRKRRKRSKSKSPLRREKSREQSRHVKDKPKHKSKDKDKDNKKKEKTRHKDRSKERDTKSETVKSSGKAAASDVESNSSDIEVLEKSPTQPKSFIEDQLPLSNGNKSAIVFDPLASNARAIEKLMSIKALSKIESADDIEGLASRTTSQGNSPATMANNSRSSTPSRSSTDTSAATSVDLMSKVRAMLKKSRELIRKEEGFSLDDT
ncbi:unnamed protein product [Lymnaea stagnalis]|uniref:SURP motif domain-containing protein n=1 Tax=Lymnaea stagnalis TaxID=6523 RepID=A0AAV2I877_LYMST